MDSRWPPVFCPRRLTSCSGYPHTHTPGRYQDLWAHTDNGTAVRNVTAQAVPAHGVVALLLKDAGDEPANSGPPCARPQWCISQNGTLVPGA